MAEVIFSSWQGEIVDNRGKAKENFAAVTTTKLPEELGTGLPVKAFMGWDGIILCGDDVDIIDMTSQYADAVQKESCGRCIPCRIGSKIVADILKKIAAGQGQPDDLEKIKTTASTIRDGAKCQIGQTGFIPVLDALRYFGPLFATAINEKKSAKKGTYRTSVTAPCMSVCPTQLDIPRYIENIREECFSDSLATIREGTCLAGTLGRVCVRPCESNCRRANIDEPVSIKHLKRFAADYEIEKSRKPSLKVKEKGDKKVAVIGAGPAGLSCAYYLVQMGYNVTVFEKLGEPGGMAAVGIPDYRLPRNILGNEGAFVESLGAQIRYNTTFGKDITMGQLKKEFAAAFFGVGAHNSSPMGVEGENSGYKGFITGVKYLLDINLGKDPYPQGKKVVVVGGGNVAMDCVRSSFRIGKSDVHLVYRRTKTEMPADHVEIREAEEEGVVFHYLCNPVRIIEKDGKVVGVECIRMELGELDASGRRRPVPVPGSEFVIETDILIPAIGQVVDFSFLEKKEDFALTKWKTFQVNQETFETSVQGVFSAGDCETGPDVLVRACGNGKRAAWKIDEYLRGETPAARESEKFVRFFGAVKVYDKNEHIGIIGDKARYHLKAMAPEVRKWTFAEVEEGYKVNEAVGEASRCLRCYRIGMIAAGQE